MNIYNNKKKDKEYKNIMKILENLQCIINRYSIFENIKIKYDKFKDTKRLLSTIYTEIYGLSTKKLKYENKIDNKNSEFF